jgi:hypothetical protein
MKQRHGYPARDLARSGADRTFGRARRHQAERSALRGLVTVHPAEPPPANRLPRSATLGARRFERRFARAHHAQTQVHDSPCSVVLRFDAGMWLSDRRLE